MCFPQELRLIHLRPIGHLRRRSLALPQPLCLMMLLYQRLLSVRLYHLW